MSSVRLIVIFLFSFVFLALTKPVFSQAPVIQWQKNNGGSGQEIAYSVYETTDDGYILCGYTTTSADGNVTSNRGLSDAWIVKLNRCGSIEWQKTYGGSNYDNSFCI